MEFKVTIGKIMYSIARLMPSSYSRIQIGQKKIRALCGKLIMDSIGENVNIEKGAVFSGNCSVGNNSGIGINCVINGTCIIGNDVMMGPNCVIYTMNHAFDRVDIPMNMQGNSIEKPVIIGDDVWIGSNVIILPGVEVGNHSIIGAGSVVSKNIAEWSIVAGNPACLKRKRIKEIQILRTEK